VETVMAETTPQEMNQFVKTVDEFMANYAKLISPETKGQVYATGNPTLISNYENAVTQSRILKRTIEATVGAWNVAKKAWASVTGVTSTFIGDAIDTVRSWFGYDPASGVTRDGMDGLGCLGCPANECENCPVINHGGPVSGMGALGIVQLPAAAWIAGIIAAAYLLNGTMKKIFISIEATRIIKADPNISRGRALEMASSAVSTNFFGSATMPLIAAGLIAVYFLLGSKSR
jgi:hypothetical protein